jgi:hypothetical protein
MPAPAYQPLKGFAPDLDPTTPGIIVDCSMMVPTVKGMKGAAAMVPTKLPTLPKQSIGAATVQLLSGTLRAFAGMADSIYESISNTWTDVTRRAASGELVAGGDPLNARMGESTLAAGDPIPYRSTNDNTWRFAQFGNVSLAVNGADPIQQSLTSGPFSDIPGAPTADVIDVTQGFVFVANVLDANYGERPDGWWCSGIYDQTIWTPSIASQCATGRLIDTPGEITACRALGSNIVLYKGTSFYFGTYQGPPVIWGFNVVSNQIGVFSQEAVISIGTAHIFCGNDNFYSYDGTRPLPIGDEVKEWFFANRSPGAMYRMRSMRDPRNSLCYWFFVSVDSLDQKTLDRGLVFNHRANKWGRADYIIENPFEQVTGQMTYDSLGTFYPTWDQLPSVSYNSPFWVQSSRVPAVIDTAHRVQTLTGATVTCGLQTGEFGDDEVYTDLQYVRIRCVLDPVSATMATRHRYTLGNTKDEQTKTNVLHDGKFDVDASARWHNALFQFKGDVEIMGYAPALVPDGSQ